MPPITLLTTFTPQQQQKGRCSQYARSDHGILLHIYCVCLGKEKEQHEIFGVIYSVLKNYLKAEAYVLNLMNLRKTLIASNKQTAGGIERSSSLKSLCHCIAHLASIFSTCRYRMAASLGAEVRIMKAL